MLSMPSRISHDRTKARKFTGEDDAARVVDWLNGGKLKDDGWYRLIEADESRSRVLDVISSIQRLLGTIERRQGWKPKQPADKKQPLEISTAFQELNTTLHSYTSFPCFYPEPNKSRRWDMSEVLSGDHPVGESLAVHAAVRLADQNMLERLKVCDCGLWYFAKFSHQKFCSAECRVRFWESSEERMERKRERLRQNYLYKKAHKGK
jgi:hypothetical protein